MGVAEALALRGERALQERLGALRGGRGRLRPAPGFAAPRRYRDGLRQSLRAPRPPPRIRGVGVTLPSPPGGTTRFSPTFSVSGCSGPRVWPRISRAAAKAASAAAPNLEVGMQDPDRVLGACDIGVGPSELFRPTRSASQCLRGGGEIAGLAVPIAQPLDHRGGGRLSRRRSAACIARARSSSKTAREGEPNSNARSPRASWSRHASPDPLGEPARARRAPQPPEPGLPSAPPAGPAPCAPHSAHQQRGSLRVLGSAQGPLAIAERRPDTREGLVRLHDLEPTARRLQCHSAQSPRAPH